MKNPIYYFTILFLISITLTYAQNPPRIKAYNQNLVPFKNWDKTFGSNQSDIGLSVEALPDGGYILAGFSSGGINGNKNSINKGLYDFWVVKLNPNGEILWEKSFGNTSNDNARIIIKCSDGGFLIGGDSNSPQGGDKSQNAHLDNNGVATTDYWVIKIDSFGNKEWDKRFGGNGYESIMSIIEVSDGGFLLGGESESNNGGDKTENTRGQRDGWVIKINSLGNKIWDKTLGGNKSEGITNMLELPDGNYLLSFNCFAESTGGDITIPPKGGSDIWLVKITNTGFVMWDKRFGSTSDERFPSMVKTNDNHIFIASETGNAPNGDVSTSSIGGRDFWLLKINLNGNKIWDKRFGGFGDDGTPTITKTYDNRYLLSGATMSNAGGDISESYKSNNDIWIVKIDDEGNKYWNKRIGCDNLYHFGPNNFKPTKDLGFIFIGASSANISYDKTENSYGDNDFWVIKTGINGLESPLCIVPSYNFSLVASGCEGVINWPNNLTGNAIHLNNINEVTEVSATCTSNGSTSIPSKFIFNTAWYQRNLFNSISNTSEKYIAITNISAYNQISQNANVRYHAGSSITLGVGFKVEGGSIFKASIGDCND